MDLSKKLQRTSPVELVSREEYEKILQFYKDVYMTLGMTEWNPDAENINSLIDEAKKFIDKHSY